MIKAVIFDFGSVLVGGDLGEVYRKIAKKLRISQGKILEITMPLLKKWNKGKINEEKFWQGLEKKTGEKLPPEFKKDLWYRNYIEYRSDIKESWKILAELKKRKFRLAILSNTIPPHVKVNKKIGRLERLKRLGFEALIWSCEVGTRKPDPEIYKIALQKLNLLPEECVFIDDKKVNVEAAKKLGIHGIVFQAPEQLREEFLTLGLL